MSFRIIAATLSGFPSLSLVPAAERAGYTGLIGLEYCDGEQSRRLLAALAGRGVSCSAAVARRNQLPAHNQEMRALGLKEVVLIAAEPGCLEAEVRALGELGVPVLVEVRSLAQALAAQAGGAAGLVVKGSESGGLAGDETAFVLLQHVKPWVSIPVLVRGGIGLHSAAACMAAGAAGAVLDWQLALCEESELPESVRARVAAMDGSETTLLGPEEGPRYRVFARPGEKACTELLAAVELARARSGSDRSWIPGWVADLEARVRAQELLLIGQDAALARHLILQSRTVAGICRIIEHEAARQCRVAAQYDPLRCGAPLAQSQGTEYPIVQGPMTRVSDRAEFALAVARAGALPCLACGLMDRTELSALLEETGEKLGSLPWAVGMLGFAPLRVWDSQLSAIRLHKPPYAVLAGGRPDQAIILLNEGIQTYLHVPSPDLLRSALSAGVRRVVFEGRECGGHVGPRTSFVLWELMVRELLGYLRQNAAPGQAEEYHVLFAGGILDTTSAAMVAALAAPLSERGVRIGVLMGTGYLFTREAVVTGAILPGFQGEAVRCTATVLLESGAGHAVRCANTPLARQFEAEKLRLAREGQSREEIRHALDDLLIGRLRIAAKGTAHAYPGQVSPDLQYRDGLFMMGEVAALREHIGTIEELHRDIARGGELIRERVRPELDRWGSRDGIAIVGMACLFPKARDVQEYWHNILAKVNAVTEIPEDRFPLHRYFDADRSARDKIYSRWGGFLEDTPFDPLFHGMPPSSLLSIEPAHLLTLETVRLALLDAGYLERRFRRERTSVILGTGGGTGELGLDYSFRSLIPQYLMEAGAPSELIADLEQALPEWTEDSFAGILPNLTAGRVANRFDLGGANYIVDAACASSLAALRLAANELESGSSDVVITGGIEVNQSTSAYLGFAKTQALSPSGQCRTFDQSADGIVISEGVAIIVLKRLLDAIRDGDRVYAILRGVAASSDGRSKALTAPRPVGQMRALERAYEKAGVPANTIGLLEAHGTGTVVGDRIEIESLTAYFRNVGAQRQGCALGSVKSMIGHTKSAAGFAGLIKSALALHCKILPPTMGVSVPNVQADFGNSPFYLNTEARPWLKRLDGAPRRAGISAFGFGGTNLHAVLEEFDADEEASPLRVWPAELFLWQGSSEQIRSSIQEIEKALAGGARPRFSDLAAAVCWQQGRQPGERRLAIVANSLDDLMSKLASAVAALKNPEEMRGPTGIYLTAQTPATSGKVAFLFPGQGSQHVEMLRDLALAFPLVRATFEEADEVLDAELGQPLSGFIFPPPPFSDTEKERSQNELKQTRVAQPAIGAADMAMCRLLRHLGIEPEMAAGHSYGELVALAAAGVFSFRDLIRISETRGRLITEKVRPEPGVMAAIEAAERDIVPVISSLEGVWVANLNAPLQTVISGTQAGIEAAVERFAAQKITCRLLPVACAFHSALVASAQEPFREALKGYEFRAPCFPVFCNVTGDPYPAEPDRFAGLLCDQLVNPVRFASEAQAMYDAGARVFVECGPGRVLTGLINNSLAGTAAVKIQTDQPGANGIVSLLQALAQLAVAGVDFRPYGLFERRVTGVPEMATVLAPQTKSASTTTWTIRSGKAVPPPGFRTDRKALARRAVTCQAVASEEAGSKVMQAHQELMRSFVETEERIMRAFFERSRGAVICPDTLPERASAPAETPPQTPVPEHLATPDANPNREKIEHELVSIVSARTGYPAYTIGLDLDMEADLGIDSLKRVEIFAALAEKMRVPLDADALSGLNTLGAIAERLAAGSAPTEVSLHTAQPAIERLIVAAVEAPEIRDDANRGREELVLIVDDGTNLPRLLSEKITAQGGRAEIVAPECVQTVNGSPISGVLHLPGLIPPEAVDFEDFGPRMERELKSLFLLVRAQDARLMPEAVVLAATRMGGALAAVAPAQHFWPGSGALAGFLKTLALERPQIHCRVVDFASHAGEKEIAAALLRELNCRDGLTEAGYQGGQRLTLEAVPRATVKEQPRIALSPASVILMTGGARGITAQIAVELAQRYQPKLVLLGRTSLTESGGALEIPLDDERKAKRLISDALRSQGVQPLPRALEAEYQRLRRHEEISANLEAMRGAGSAVEYHVVDVADQQAFQSLIESIYARLGRIDGVIHGAGIIENRLIRDQSSESFDRISMPKIHGALTLARSLRQEKLQFLAFFSSVAARFGNPGQADYAATNEVLSKLAAWLNARWTARVCSIDWGPWDTDRGMVTVEQRERFRRAGMRMVSTSEGRSAFVEELLYGRKEDTEVILGAPIIRSVAVAAENRP